jgi:hypothetical protein
MLSIKKGGFFVALVFFCICLLLGCGTASASAADTPMASPALEEAVSAEPVSTAAEPSPAVVSPGYVRDAARFEEARREAEKLKASDSRQDYASSAVFANFREIRFGVIPSRTLYRGSHPALPGNARFPYAQQLAENARVATVLNLADTEEEIAVRAEGIPWYQNFITKNNIIALAMSGDFTVPEFSAKLKSALSFMAARNPPYLIHGIEGKDRTGFTTALLEALMGASAQEIIDDFLTSYVNLYKIPADGDSYRIIAYLAGDLLLMICDGKEAGQVNLQAAAERYILEKIGLGRGELDSLKQKLSGS